MKFKIIALVFAFFLILTPIFAQSLNQSMDLIISTNKNSYEINENIELNIKTTTGPNNGTLPNTNITITNLTTNQKNSIKTDTQGNAIYTTKAQKSGNLTIQIQASQTGYQQKTKNANIVINELKPISIIVWNSQGLPIENAQIYLDSTLAGTTNTDGKVLIKIGGGIHLIEAKNSLGTTCSSKTIDLYNSNGLSFICQAGNLVVKIDSQDNYPIANVYIFLNGKQVGWTNSTGALFLENIDYGNHEVYVFLRTKVNETETIDLAGSKTITLNQPYLLQEFKVSINEISAMNVNDNNKLILLSEKNVKPQLIPAIVVGAIVVYGVVVGAMEGLDYGKQCVGPYFFQKQWMPECDTKTLMVGTNIILSTEKGATVVAGAMGKIGSTTLQTIEKIPIGTKALKIAENTIEFLTPIKSTLIKADQTLDEIAWKILYRSEYLTTKYGTEATNATEKILAKTTTYWRTKETEGITKTIASHPDSVVEGEAIIDSMIKSKEWTETMTKTATAMDGQENNINAIFRKSPEAGPDATFKINNKLFNVETTKKETLLDYPMDLQSKILDEVDHFKNFAGQDNTINVVLTKDTTLDATTQENIILNLFNHNQLPNITRVQTYNSASGQVVNVNKIR